MSCSCDDAIKATETLTACECEGPGFCDRHKCHKTEHFYNLCKSRSDYYALWEEGRGPCIAGRSDSAVAAITSRPPERWVGLGDVAELLIRWVTFGRLKPWPGCGCDRRKTWLNQVRLWRITS
jgi:hypothetical protein